MSDLEALDVVEDDCLPVPELGQQMLDEGLQLHGDLVTVSAVSAVLTLDIRAEGGWSWAHGHYTGPGADRAQREHSVHCYLIIYLYVINMNKQNKVE